MPCLECRELTTHTFRSPDDLIHAVRLAAEEVNRGVLAREGNDAHDAAAQEAVESSLACGALPGTIRYRFRCEVCGDRFSLVADTERGTGAWSREGEEGGCAV